MFSSDAGIKAELLEQAGAKPHVQTQSDTESQVQTQPATADDLAAALGLQTIDASKVATVQGWFNQQGSSLPEKEEPEEVIIPGNEKMVEELRACLQEGDVNPRSAWGQRFTAYLKANKEEAEKYNSKKGQSGANLEKKKFRLAWAKQELSSRVTLSKTRLQALEDIVGEQGKYAAFDRICVWEGGLDNPNAVRRATNYALEAIARGPPYVEFHTWKKETEILYFEKVRSSIFRDTFKLERHEVMAPPANTPAEIDDDRSTPAKIQKPAVTFSGGVEVNELARKAPRGARGEARGDPQ